MRCTSSLSRVSASVALALVLALVPALSPALHAQQAIQVFLSAIDSAGRPVTDLRTDEVNVLANGSVCKTTKFEAIDWPTKLTLMVDNGPIHTDALRQLREALRLFIAELPTDMDISLVSFDPAPRFIYKGGTDRVKLLSSVDLLIPDQGAPKFIDALAEAADRVDKEKRGKKETGNFFPVFMIVGSAGIEGSNPRDYEIMKLFKQVQDNAITVHVVMEQSNIRSNDPASGTNQIEVGLRLTQGTRGRYEAINSETRLSTLLPEYGKQIAKSVLRQSHQYRITCLPSGAPTQIAASIERQNVTAALTIDGRLP